jgi:serine/threonine protein kinase/Rieske Fe-S protein
MQTVVVDNLVGQVLGTYRVERLMGQGRVNAVYLARHLENESTVAVTLYILPEKFSSEARQRFMQRFRKEGSALVALRHEHILPVHDFGEYQGYPYLVTPYMMNGSLADLLKREGRLDHEYVGEILEQIVAGLEYAHARKVVHGTLKPANIVLDAEQKMQVAGFGLMHILQKRGIEASEQPYAHLYSIVDTFLAAPEYLAPEIVQGQSIDTRSDVYALGIILFELLAGKVPFTGSTPIETARKHVDQAIPLLRTQHPDIPIAISSVVNQALDRDPARRFQRAGELAEAFAQASLGATSSHNAYKVQGSTNRAATQSDRSSSSKGRSQSTGSWQFSPPIMTNQVESVPSQNKDRAAQPRSTKPATGNTDSWQFLPPVVTGDLPAIDMSKQTDGYVERVSAVPPANDRVYEVPKPAPKPAARAPYASSQQSMPGISSKEQDEAAAAWWSQPQEPVFLGDDAAAWDKQPDYSYGQPYSPPAPTRRPRTTGRRGRGGVKPGRRKVVAMIAAGGVAVIGGGVLVAANKNMMQMANAVLKPNNTQGTKAQIAATGGNGKQMSVAGQKAQNGKVVGSAAQAKNTAVAFTNPADQKASLLMHLPTGTFTAFERGCTHEGVNVNYDPGTHTLVCPAHGAIFDSATGAVIQGPATKPIPKVTVRVNGDGTITV